MVFTGVIAIDPNPVHRPAMGDLQFADNRDVVLRLAGDDTGAATSADIEIDRHAPLLGRVERRMAVDAWQPMGQVFLTGNFFRELIVGGKLRASLPERDRGLRC